jgi:hypothetical protein
MDIAHTEMGTPAALAMAAKEVLDGITIIELEGGLVREVYGDQGECYLVIDRDEQEIVDDDTWVGRVWPVARWHQLPEGVHRLVAEQLADAIAERGRELLGAQGIPWDEVFYQKILGDMSEVLARMFVPGEEEDDEQA